MEPVGATSDNRCQWDYSLSPKQIKPREERYNLFFFFFFLNTPCYFVLLDRDTLEIKRCEIPAGLQSFLPDDGSVAVHMRKPVNL